MLARRLYTRVGGRLCSSLQLEFVSPQDGPVAQLGARLNGIQEVTGSIPVRSTTFLAWIMSELRVASTLRARSRAKICHLKRARSPTRRRVSTIAALRQFEPRRSTGKP